MTYTANDRELDRVMFQEIMNEIRHIRDRLDHHIDEENEQLRDLGKDLGKVKEELRGYKARLSTIAGVISMAVALFTSVFSERLAAWLL